MNKSFKVVMASLWDVRTYWQRMLILLVAAGGYAFLAAQVPGLKAQVDSAGNKADGALAVTVLAMALARYACLLTVVVAAWTASMRTYFPVLVCAFLSVPAYLYGMTYLALAYVALAVLCAGTAWSHVGATPAAGGARSA
jgi:hypothetical protein